MVNWHISLFWTSLDIEHDAVYIYRDMPSKKKKSFFVFAYPYSSSVYIKLNHSVSCFKAHCMIQGELLVLLIMVRCIMHLLTKGKKIPTIKIEILHKIYLPQI